MKINNIKIVSICCLNEISLIWSPKVIYISDYETYFILPLSELFSLYTHFLLHLRRSQHNVSSCRVSFSSYYCPQATSDCTGHPENSSTLIFFHSTVFQPLIHEPLSNPAFLQNHVNGDAGVNGRISDGSHEQKGTEWVWDWSAFQDDMLGGGSMLWKDLPDVRYPGVGVQILFTWILAAVVSDI